jgi:hypothetical protein
MSPPRIRIFKPGRFTAVDGQEVEFTHADLEGSALAYDAASDPAPLVVGHPKLNAPAFGWIKALAVEDGHLVADVDPGTLEPAFAEAVRARRYPKVSASFYPPAHPSNPTPGSYHLKHVGFLGAAAPGVKGLGLVHFAEEERGLIVIETQAQENTMSEKDPKVIEFAEREAELARLEEALTEREAAVVTREQTAAATVRQALHASNLAFAEQLVAAGKLAPAGKELVVGVMDELEATATVSFGEANGEMTPIAAFKKLFDGAHPVINFGEAAPPGNGDQAGAASFAAPAGYGTDPAKLAIHQKALELQAANSELSYLDAVKQAGG